MVLVKKQTAKRLREEGNKGETHNNLINRLIVACEEREESITLSEDTIQRLVKFTGSVDADEAINVLIDQYRRGKHG